MTLHARIIRVSSGATAHLEHDGLGPFELTDLDERDAEGHARHRRDDPRLLQPGQIDALLSPSQRGLVVTGPAGHDRGEGGHLGEEDVRESRNASMTPSITVLASASRPASISP